MLPQITSYVRPAGMAEAWGVLSELGPTARPVAGGTDLVARCPAEVTTLVDLAGLGLRYVDVEADGGIRIGAMATFTDLLEDPTVARYAAGVLPETLVHVGSMLHRNSATIGGHVVRGRLSDVIPVLLALDAEVVVFDGTEHVVGLADYYDLGRNRDRHLVSGVRLPAAGRDVSAAAFVRFSRSVFDHALVNVACRLDVADGIVAAARIVVGEIADRGRRAPDAEAVLVDAAPTPDAIAQAAAVARASLDVAGDWMITADYRRHLVDVLVRRCLTTAAARAEVDQ